MLLNLRVIGSPIPRIEQSGGCRHLLRLVLHVLGLLLFVVGDPSYQACEETEHCKQKENKRKSKFTILFEVAVENEAREVFC